MTRMTGLLCAALSFASLAGAAHAEGVLNIFNWGQYTNPELIKKFEKTYDVKVNLDTYDSNETLLAKIKAGASGYDIVVPSDYMVKIMIHDGLLAKTEPNTMSNFKYVKPAFRQPYYDPGLNYTVPWQIGTTGITVNDAVYKGKADSWSLIFNPPEELRGRINVLDDMGAVINAAELYLGVPLCTDDRANLKKVATLLQTAKPYWRSFNYDALNLLTAGSVDVSMDYSGESLRAREIKPSLTYVYPKEGLTRFIDNVAVLKDAPDMKNAKLFQNFVMDPQNAALISDYAKYSSGIEGASKYLDKSLAGAPEIVVPAGVKPKLAPLCQANVMAIYNNIWTNLRK